MANFDILFEINHNDTNIYTCQRSYESSVDFKQLQEDLKNELDTHIDFKYIIKRTLIENKKFKKKIDIKENQIINSDEIIYVEIDKDIIFSNDIFNDFATNNENDNIIIIETTQSTPQLESTANILTNNNNIINLETTATISTASSTSRINNSNYNTILNELRKELVNNPTINHIPARGTHQFNLWRRAVIRKAGNHMIDNNKNGLEKQTKIYYAMAIVDIFPILKSTNDPKGYEHIYDETTGQGFLNTYVKNKRHRDPYIKTREYNKKRKYDELDDEENVVENEINEEQVEKLIALMKNKPIITDQDRDDSINAMQKTSSYRIKWIKKQSPDLTTILKTYPKFKVLPHLISDEFKYYHKEKNDEFLMQWSKLESNLIKYAETSRDINIVSILNNYKNDNTNENTKSRLAFELLCNIVGGIKKSGGKVANNSVKNYIFHIVKMVPFDELTNMIKSYTLQPVYLFLIMSKYL
jgi:hypothetical protein